MKQVGLDRTREQGRGGVPDERGLVLWVRYSGREVIAGLQVSLQRRPLEDLGPGEATVVTVSGVGTPLQSLTGSRGKECGSGLGFLMR